MTAAEFKAQRKENAKKEYLWDFLNEAVEELTNAATDKQIIALAEQKYKAAGLQPLGWLSKRLLYKEYFY